jgi:hypothetical protein
VYVERDVIVVEDPDAERRRERGETLAPDVLATLGLLADTHDVIVLTAEPLPRSDGQPTLATAAELPVEHPAGGWLLTVDPAVCAGDRPTGIRTILVGPRRPPDRRPTARCDVEARDLSAAVMEILVRDTMS